MTKLPAPESVNDHWDSYLALVDDAAASILVNMHFVGEGRPEGLPVLHHWALPMRWPGEHGMGTQDEAQGFAAVEEQVTAELMERGFYPVGRLRTAGYWQVSYYAADERGEEMSAVIEGVVGEAVATRVHAEAASDPKWEYFFDLLCPDAQQMQWMADRDVVMQLIQHGDPLTERPVEHLVHFAEEEKCREFARMAAEDGFDCAIMLPSDEEPHWTVQATRADSVELDEIHVIADGLRRLALDHDGDYDGWGTELVQPDAPSRDESN